MDLERLKPDPNAAQLLLKNAENGASESLVSLAALYREFLKHWVREQLPRQLRKRVGSSTVAQETLLRVKLAAESIQCGTLAQFEHYILEIARNVIIDLRRFHLAAKRSMALDQSLEELESRAFWNSVRTLAVAGPDELAELRDEAEHRLRQIYAALLSLPSHYQKIIRAHFEIGQELQEIADELGRSKNATRMLLKRAVYALKEKVIADDGGLSEQQ